MQEEDVRGPHCHFGHDGECFVSKGLLQLDDEEANRGDDRGELRPEECKLAPTRTTESQVQTLYSSYRYGYLH